MRFEREFLYRLYWKEKMSMPKIAKRLGVSLNCISYWMKKHKIKRRDISSATKLSMDKRIRTKLSEVMLKYKISKEELKKLYKDKGLSIYEISNIFDSSPVTIYFKLKKYRIPIRSRSKERMGTKNPFYGRHHTEETMKRWMEAVHKRPTSLEQKFINLIKKHNLPFEYTGDGKFMIEGKCPDFVCTNSKKLLEVFGEYWHTERVRGFKDTEDGRKKIFSKYGFDTLVLWENELDDEAFVMEKLKNFMRE